MIKLDHDYHGVEFQRPISSETYQWLVEKYGTPNGDIWFLRNNTVYFSREQDHMMFLLTWG
jgi:hypothetical protein